MPLPSFIVIGERRSGTTTLHHILDNHPDVFMCSKADINFFTEDSLDSRKWKEGKLDPSEWGSTHNLEQYLDLFKGSENFKASGHKGADLFFWQPAHKRMKEFTPNSKFILTLRNPVSRAWSHYWNEVGKGRESLSFEKAIEAENERAARSDYGLFHLSYINRGFYDISLQKFLEIFPREQLLVLILEDFYVDPKAYYDSICNFIEVSSSVYEKEPSSVKNRNFFMLKKDWVGDKGVFNLLDKIWMRVSDAIINRVGKDRESKTSMRLKYQAVFRQVMSEQSMDEKTKKRLKEVYLPHIINLEKMLGRELNSWKDK